MSIIPVDQWSEVPGGGMTDVSVAASVFINRLYLFGKGIDDKHIYFNSMPEDNQFLDNLWNNWSEVDGGGMTDVAVAAVAFKDRLYLFGKGIDDKRIYFNSTADGQQWNNQWSEVDGGGMTDVAVAAVVFKDRLYLFGKGIDDKRIYFNSTADGQQWNNQWLEVDGGGTTDVSVAAVVFKDRLYLFGKGIDDKRIYFNSTADGQQWNNQWLEVKDGGTTDVSVSAAVFGDRLHLYSKGIDDGCIYENSTFNGIYWPGAVSIEHQNLRGPTPVKPTVILASYRLWIFALSPNQHIHGNHWVLI